MLRRSPAVCRRSPWCPLLGVILLAFLVKACAEPQPRDGNYEPTEPQLARAAASCDVGPDGEPCVVVRVKAPGNMDLPDGLIVTLVAGQNGPYDDGGRVDGTPLKQPISDGVAVFQAPDYDLQPGGYCAWVAPVTDWNAFTAGGSFVVPTSLAVPTEGSTEPVGGAVSDTERKSVPLTGGAYEDNCLWFWPSASPSTPPGVLEEGGSLTFDLTLQTAASYAAHCHSTQGGENQTGLPVDCPTWGIVPLDEDDAGEQLSVAEILEKIPWADATMYGAGVRIGILESVGFGDASYLYGLTPGQVIAIETAQNDLTASAYDKEPKGGSKKHPAVTETVELDYLPLACTDETEPAESADPGVPGIDFLTVHHGYYGKVSLQSGTFVADPERVAFWYRYVVNESGSTLVNLHARLKQRPGETDDFPETINVVGQIDFAGCPDNPPSPGYIEQDLGDSDKVRVDVSCRTPLDAAEGEIEAFLDFTFPGSRQVELRLDVTDGDTYPDPARSDYTRSMVLQEFWDGICPLNESPIGKSTDPKWWVAN
jgi:hypothetical protein